MSKKIALFQLKQIKNTIYDQTKTFQNLLKQCESMKKLMPTLDSKGQAELQNIQDNILIELGRAINQLNELSMRCNDLQEYRH
jgi:hypothetical protein